MLSLKTRIEMYRYIFPSALTIRGKSEIDYGFTPYVLTQAKALTALGTLSAGQIITLLGAPNNTTTFLRGDGTFTIIPSGSMQGLESFTTAFGFSAGDNFLPLVNSLSGSATEANTQYTLITATKYVYLAVNVTTNARSALCSATLRKTGVDTAVTVAIGSNQTGWLVDLAHVASFAIGDKTSIRVNVGGSSGGFAITAYEVSPST